MNGSDLLNYSYAQRQDKNSNFITPKPVSVYAVKGRQFGGGWQRRLSSSGNNFQVPVGAGEDLVHRVTAVDRG